MHGVDEVEVRKLILRFLEGGELIVPDDWRERVGRGEIVPQAVKEWQMREHPGHTASVVAMFRDGGAMYNHDNFEKAVRTGIPSLVVLGEYDDLCTEEQLRGYGFNDVYVVPQAGHGVVREQVPEVAGFITNFWNGLD
jgi:pimeloyl-ACP methyl ester carboxylesterase